jgi:hypothetical protein
VGHARAQLHAILHFRPSQVDVTIAQAIVVMHVFFVELKRRGFGSVQNFKLLRQQLDLAGRHFGILGTLGPQPQLALDPEHKLVAQRFGVAEHGCIVGIENHLQHTFLVAQVDKDDAAVIATTIYPATDADLLIDVLLIEFTTVMRPHNDWSEN